MANTKTTTVLANNVVLVTGTATTTYPTTAPNYVDLSSALAAAWDAKFTNGATGPTTPAQIQPQVSGDPTAEWYDFGGARVSATGNNVVSTFGGEELPVAAKYVRFNVGSNSGGSSVTFDLDITVLTSS